MLAEAPALGQHQAPMLDELVASGAIPPLEERLPANPLVVTPVAYSLLDDLGQKLRWRGWATRTAPVESLAKPSALKGEA